MVEQEIVEQTQEIERLKARMEELNKRFSLFETSIFIYENMKRRLQEKLNDLYVFNTVSNSNYGAALELASSVMDGLEEVLEGGGFNSNTQTFSTEEMNLEWIAKLEYTKKVIKVMKYEEAHPEHADSATVLLSSLEEKDRIEIKYILYTAEEPYRTITFQYMDQLKVIPEEIDPNKKSQPSYFTPNKNTITYVYENGRTNARGLYFTFFHELGHAIDYNYGIDEGKGGYYTDYNKRNRNTLAGHMHKDVGNRIREELGKELEKTEYSDMNYYIKSIMINNITDTFIYKGPSDVYGKS